MSARCQQANLKRCATLLLAAAAVWVMGAVLGQVQVVGQTNGLGTKFSLVSPEESGIEFQHSDGSSGDRYVVETVIGSLALFDYDLDGLVDIYLINGAPLPATKKNAGNRPTATPTPGNRLYRNLGNWRFADVTQSSGLGALSYGMGVVVAMWMKMVIPTCS